MTIPADQVKNKIRHIITHWYCCNPAQYVTDEGEEDIMCDCCSELLYKLQQMLKES